MKESEVLPRPFGRSKAWIVLTVAILFLCPAPPAGNLQERLAYAGALSRDDDPLSRARSLFEAGNLDEALEYSKRVESGEPKNREVHLLTGRIYLAQAAKIERSTGFAGSLRRDLLGEAEESFRKALSMDDRCMEAKRLLAFTLVLLTNLSAAENELEELLNINPNDSYGLYLLAEIRLMKEDAESAVELFLKSLEEKGENRTDARIGLIRALTRADRLGEAEKALCGLAEEEPRLMEVFNLAVGIYEPGERFGEAADLYHRLLRLAPDRLDLLFREGYALYRMARYAEAKQCFDGVLSRDPQQEETLYFKGAAALAQADYPLARKCFEQAARLEGIYLMQALSRLHEIALFGAKEQRFQEALDLFDLILGLNPFNTAVLADKALLLSQTARSSEADAVYEELLQIDPWDSSAVNNYALHLLGGGRTEEGLNRLRKAVELDRNLDALENLGAYHYYSSGNHGRALEYFQAVLDSAPERTKSLVLSEILRQSCAPDSD